jgi:hypothetical protein
MSGQFAGLLKTGNFYIRPNFNCSRNKQERMAADAMARPVKDDRAYRWPAPKNRLLIYFRPNRTFSVICIILRLPTAFCWGWMGAQINEAKFIMKLINCFPSAVLSFPSGIPNNYFTVLKKG